MEAAFFLLLKTKSPGFGQATSTHTLATFQGTFCTLCTQTPPVCHGHANSRAFPDGPAHVLSVSNGGLEKGRKENGVKEENGRRKEGRNEGKIGTEQKYRETAEKEDSEIPDKSGEMEE